MNSNLCDYSYDERLMENEFLKSHDYYLPYVGVNYRFINYSIVDMKELGSPWMAVKYPKEYVHSLIH